MTVDDARALLTDAIRDDGSLKSGDSMVVFWRRGEHIVFVEGEYTLTALEAICTWIQHVQQDHPVLPIHTAMVAKWFDDEKDT